ncbi:MAG: ABC transporter ATP-binding protein [Patescibacteria group bacterium]|nr:ABC transporter ATP-binding protein [Patescibacteria group bacterium]MDD5715427.1 ABC transporter ATP-binding protein [Patescibacteria group bacterium]
MVETIIEINKITKVFKIPHERKTTLKEYFVSAFSHRTYEQFHALREVSFSVREGEFLGIIGRNGSGKSTLLKIIAGILQPNSGRIAVLGSIAPFLELGVGFQPDLTARENVYLYGAILGLSRTAIDQKFDSIIKFAELENFVDQKLKNFSSGMQVRLAFSTAIQSDADILLVDEVLAVGDADFQRKCFNTFDRLKREKKTIIFVSHDLGSIERFCDRVVFIEGGKVKNIGKPREMITAYGQSFTDTTPENIEARATSGIYITKVAFSNEQGEEKKTFKTGETIRIKIFCKTNRAVHNVIFGLEFANEQGLLLSGINMGIDHLVVEKVEGEKQVEFIIQNNPFLDGMYYVTPAVADKSGDLIFDRVERIFRFYIANENQKKYFGFIQFPYTWRF